MFCLASNFFREKVLIVRRTATISRLFIILCGFTFIFLAKLSLRQHKQTSLNNNTSNNKNNINCGASFFTFIQAPNDEEEGNLAVIVPQPSSIATVQMSLDRKCTISSKKDIQKHPTMDNINTSTTIDEIPPLLIKMTAKESNRSK